jgi:hypothetical protein
MRRCLVVANQTLASPQLVAEMLARSAADEYEFHLLVPASHPHSSASWTTEGQGVAHARAVLAQALEWFEADGLHVTGEVGDENPVLAVVDALNRQSFDEIIVSTLQPGVSRWLKRDLPHRLERRFGVPVTHVVATPAHVS